MPNYPLDHTENFGPWKVKSVHEITGHGDLYAEYIVTDGNGPDRLLKTPRPQLENKFRFATKLLAKIDHPHIATVIDHDLKADPPYRVTELSTAGAIRTAMNTWSLGALQGDSFHNKFSAIAEAIGWLHSQGITHNRVNAGHIVIYRDKTPKLVHFRNAIIHPDNHPDTTKDIKDFNRTCRIIRTHAANLREQIMAGRQKDPTKVDALDVAPPKALVE